MADLFHSAKGSTWREHKYIKRLNGTYYYPNNYKGGRHLDDADESGGGLNDAEQEEYDTAASSLDADDIEALAREVIRGNFGNGQTRKDLLGENYQLIQDRVNEILLGSNSGSSKGVGQMKLSEASGTKAMRSGKERIDSVVSSDKTLVECLADIMKKGAYVLKNEQARQRHDKVANR